jgi:hypothetical protein
VVKLLPSPDPLVELLASFARVPRSAILLPRDASSVARCSSSLSCFFRRCLAPIAFGRSFLIPPSSSDPVLPLILSLASSTDSRRPRLSLPLLWREPALESLPGLSRRRVFEKICDNPFFGGDSDLSRAKDMTLASSLAMDARLADHRDIPHIRRARGGFEL